MPKKHFLTKQQINFIIQKYGGGHRWSLRTDITTYSSIAFSDSLERMLTINLMLEMNEIKFPYIEIRITNSAGVIIRKDRYDYVDTERKIIQFSHCEESGCFFRDFRKIKETFSSTKSSNKLQRLEQQLANALKQIERYEILICTFQKNSQYDFLNSPMYHQMQEEIDFYKALNKFNDMHLANVKTQAIAADEHLQQIYQDNIRICKHEGNMDYWIGITECWHNASDYENLREEIRVLKGIIEQKELALMDRDSEIRRLQLLLGEMKCRMDTAPVASPYRNDDELPMFATVANSTSSELDIIEHNIEQTSAKITSKKPGRPPAVDSKKIDLIMQLRNQKYSIRTIAEQLNMSVGNVHRYIKMNEKSE